MGETTNDQSVKRQTWGRDLSALLQSIGTNVFNVMYIPTFDEISSRFKSELPPHQVVNKDKPGSGYQFSCFCYYNGIQDVHWLA